MSIWTALIIFAGGLVLTVKGGDWFVDGASRIARAAGIPSFIIGATIVSLATTMPELIVSVSSAIQGKTEMAIGNAVGSVTANTALIMGVAMVFMTVLLERRKYLLQCLLLIASSAVLWACSGGGRLSLWAGLVLAAIFLTFMLRNVQSARSEMGQAEQRAPVDKKELWKNIGLFLLGAGCIVGGSQLLIRGATEIALFLKVPERVVAVTMVAVGTSLPELVTTITAIKAKESGLSVGNIIGANIIDLTLILPICSLVSGGSLPVSVQSFRVDMPVCLGFTVLAIIPMLVKQKAYKWQGALLLAGYAAYVILTF